MFHCVSGHSQPPMLLLLWVLAVTVVNPSYADSSKNWIKLSHTDNDWQVDAGGIASATKANGFQIEYGRNLSDYFALTIAYDSLGEADVIQPLSNLFSTFGRISEGEISVAELEIESIKLGTTIKLPLSDWTRADKGQLIFGANIRLGINIALANTRAGGLGRILNSDENGNFDPETVNEPVPDEVFVLESDKAVSSSPYYGIGLNVGYPISKRQHLLFELAYTVNKFNVKLAKNRKLNTEIKSLSLDLSYHF